MASQNFLLGKGERLTLDIVVRSSGGFKTPPYTFTEARNRLAPMAFEATELLDSLPSEACPVDEAVISFTLHPEYIAKSYFPKKLFDTIGVDVVGSRPKKIKPNKRSRNRDPIELETTELFAKGPRSSIRSWSQALPTIQPNPQNQIELYSIEKISAPNPREKILGKLPQSGRLNFETVIHANELDIEVIQGFLNYLEKQEINFQLGHKFFAKGLWFQEMEAPVDRIEDIAVFTGVRVIRQMPGIRVLQPQIRSTNFPSQLPQLPSESAVSNDVKVAIFDGGIPDNHPLNKWIIPYEAKDLLPASNFLHTHGIGVSSAALFGHIDPKKPIPRPYSEIDHIRVLDESPGQNPYELYEILRRIEYVLESTRYDFINLSIGPDLPIEDEDIHAWTAVLDEYLSKNSTLAMIAVGNNGDGDEILGLNKIQVPSDCVNAMAIGACDKPDKEWNRATYSAKGPGRSPGLIKPDLVEFGGEIPSPFVVISPDLNPRFSLVSGTSYSTPSVLRLGIGLKALFGTQLNHLAIRTLLVHTSESSKHPYTEVGWGRVARSLEDIVLCDDDTVRVVYQGEISPAKYIRAPIPVPEETLQGKVTITATICYKTDTDPHHPGNYTRAGLNVTFRPHDGRFSRESQVHPVSAKFFGSKPPGATETDLRRDAYK